MTPFAYHRPASIEAARAALAGGSDAALLAGGMTLLPTLKNRLREVSDLIDLSTLEPPLTDVAASETGLRLGAMATHGAIEAHPVVRMRYPALAQLAAGIGDPQVRNRGTIGGSVANNDPAADWPAALLAGRAEIITDRRHIAADDFFTGMFGTALEPDEIIIAIGFPSPLSAAYAKHRHPASGYAVAGVFVARFADGVQVAVTGATSSVCRWPQAEALLNADFSGGSLDSLSFDSGDLMADMHASAEYRAQLVKVMLKRAVAALSTRSGER
jgi:aerobic carbon-monoxide dehydrogenase medium subunit